MKNNYISLLHFISKHLFTLLVLGLLFIGVESASGANYYSRATGNWNVAATWSAISGGGAGTTVPGVGDNVIIERGYTVTVNITNATCSSLTLGGTWTGTGSWAGILTFATSGSPALSVTNTVQIGANTNNGSNGTITFVSGASMIAGSLNMGNSTTTAASTLTMSANSTLTLNGVLSVAGGTKTWTPSTGTVIMNATNTLPATIFTTFNNLTCSAGTTTLSGNTTISNNLSVTAGTLATDIYLITGNAAGTMSMGAGTNLTLGRSGVYTGNQNLFPSNFTSANISLNATSTVIFQDQSYGHIPALTYGNLTISSGGNQNEDADGNITVNGILTLSANSILRLGWASTTLNVAQQLIVNGVLDFVDGTAAANSWASKTVNVTGNLSGTGIINMTQAIHTFNLNGSNNSITTFNTDANIGTVTYGSTGNQQIFASTNYRNLTISGGGTKTLSGNTTISNNLSVTAGTLDCDLYQITGNTTGTMTMASGTFLTLGRTVTPYNNINFPSNFTNINLDPTSTVVFQSPAYQVIPSLTYGNLTLTSDGAANPGNTKVAQNNLTINGNLTISDNTKFELGSGTALTTMTIAKRLIVNGILYFTNWPIKTVTVMGDLSGTGVIDMTQLAHILNLNGQNNTIGTLTTDGNNSVVNYGSTGNQQVFASPNYRSLTISGGGTKTFAGTTNINNRFTINDNVKANLGNLTHTANEYYLGAALQYKGSWGSSISTATYTNDTYFDVAASGILNTTTGACGPGYWVGASGALGTDWNTPSNWCDGHVPTESTNVYIPNVTYKPIIGVAGGLCKNITIETGSSLTLNVVTNLFVYGNWTNNGTFSASGIGSVIFSGTTSQTIGGSASASFYNLTIQNSGTVGSNLVTLSKPTTVTGALLLVDGNLVTNATNLLSITKTSNSAIMGGSSSSYIDGPVIWSLPTGLTTGTTYNFPVGDNTAYLPFTLVNPSTSANTTALVKAFNTNSGGTGNGISNTEYWQLTTTAGFTNSSVSLGKGSTTVYPYDLILGNIAQPGAYTSLGGTTGFYDITNSNAIGTNRFFALGASATPKINFVPVILGGFFYIYNFGPSNEQTFILNGTSLTDGITVSAPTHFEISLTSGTGFAPSIVLPIVSGNKVNTTPIYIRLKAGLAIGTYSSEKVTMASAGATTKEITCEGTVFATTPTIITSGGRNCPPNATQIQLGSTGDNINILYWTGPNNYYSQSPNPLILNADATYNGTYTVTGSLPTGGNLINNGDFELQNVGFSSSYAFVDSTSVPTANCSNYILGCEGTYTVVKSPKSVHGLFLPVPDHSNPGIYQMVINGATTTNVSVWSQTVKVIQNSTYQFSYWLQNVGSANPSRLQLFANNKPVGTIFTASSAAGWNQYFYNWDSGSNTDVVLDLRNQNIVPGGNDFALDDIMFRTVTQVSSSINVTSTNVVAVNITTPTTTVTTGTNVTFAATPTKGGTSPDYVWTVTNGASTTSYPTTKSNSFSYVPTNGDVISCVMTSNSTCITGNPATSNAITMIVNGNKNLWIGASGLGGTVWGDKANWTANSIPAPGDNVEFATTLNNGVAAKNDLYVSYNRIVGNIINNASGKNLIIPANTQLYVNNKITLTPVDPNAPYDQIQIKADPNLDPLTPIPNGSLIFHNSDKDNKVSGSVEMYTKSHLNTSPADENDEFFWQYFGIPVESIKADPTFYGAYVRKANEAGDETDAKYYWTELGNNDVLNAFDGYEICQKLDSKYLLFQGQLVNRDFSRILIYSSATGVKYPGQHLLANPYAAAINVTKMNFGTDIDASVSLYTTGSYGQWSVNNGVVDGTGPGQFTTIPQSAAGSNGLPLEVPSMSSMLVRVRSPRTDANSVISFNYKDVINKNTTIQKVKAVDALTNTDLISTRIDLTGQHYSDRMWIFTEPSCTKNFDNGWDGRKMLGSSLAPQIYAIEPDGDYQVNSISDMNNTDLAFQAGDEVEYTLKFTHENIQRQYAGVYLVDLIENKTVDVSETGSTYTFATTQSDAPAKRFKILTRPYEKGAPDKDAQVKIFTAPGRVFVQNLSTSKGECTLYDIAGRVIKNASFAANTVTEVINNLTQGAYVVNTITNGEKVSKRVIVQ